MNPIRLVIAEDETVVRQMLARLLGMEEDIKVVGAAPDGETALNVVRHQKPDVLLTDIRMPGQGRHRAHGGAEGGDARGRHRHPDRLPRQCAHL